MFVESIVLTEERPQATPDGHSFPVTIRSGIFCFDALPAHVRCGLLVELAMSDSNDHGDFLVGVISEILGTGHRTRAYEAVVSVPPCDPDWKMARNHLIPIELDFELTADAEIAVDVYIDGDFAADKLIKVVSFAVPDHA